MQINVFLTLFPVSPCSNSAFILTNYTTLATDFSSTYWLIAFSCANMSDLDILQSVHTDKMEELLKELTDGYNGQWEKLVLCAQVWNLPPYKIICSMADEMLAKGTINWGCIVALYTFVCLFVQVCKSGQQI